jgi:hypothetical protein
MGSPVCVLGGEVEECFVLFDDGDGRIHSCLGCVRSGWFVVVLQGVLILLVS